MLNLNVVDIHCLNFLIKKTNIFPVNKAVKLLGENFFALLSLLSNLEVLFKFPVLDQFQGLATKLPNTDFNRLQTTNLINLVNFFQIAVLNIAPLKQKINIERFTCWFYSVSQELS